MYSGLLVWIIFGLGLFILSISSSSSFSWSLSHTWTTTLGVVSVAACSSYFSPRGRERLQGDQSLGQVLEDDGGGLPQGLLGHFCLSSDGLRLGQTQFALLPPSQNGTFAV